jgi:hypothetical protein
MQTVIAYNYLVDIDKDEALSLREELGSKSRYIGEAIDVIYETDKLYSVALNKNDIDESALIIIKESARGILNYFINKHNKDNNMESYICIDEIIPVLISSRNEVYPLYTDNEDCNKELIEAVASTYIGNSISNDKDYLTNGEKDVILIIVLNAGIKHHPIAIFNDNDDEDDNDDGENEE